MASLCKMSIRGIRSFSPDRDETIEFYSPLTMIVGANGCGKTTIIESLKFSCTGQLPPNSRAGKSFVNDPTMTESTEVKANIKLRFLNKQSKATVVVRNLQLTKKRAKLEYKALEGVVRMTNDVGENVSISQKCTELDKHIPELLGVSSAIMDNVIFCHQEESTWPLQEGAMLKKKFDDIFESTRYSKALDAIFKSKKDFNLRAKDLKADVAELGAHLKNATDMRDRLESCRDRQDICQRELDTIAENVEKVESKLDKSKEKMKKSQSALKDLHELEWKAAESSRRVTDKEAGLEQQLEGTDNELKNLLADFEGDMMTYTTELKSQQRALDGLNQEIATLRDHTNKLHTRQGEAQALKVQVDSQRVAMQSLIIELTRKYSLTPPSNTTAATTITYARNFLSDLDRKCSQISKETQSVINQLREKSAQCEKESMDSRISHQSLQREVNNKDQEISKVTKEKDSIRYELSSAVGRRVNVRSLKEELQLEYEEAKHAQEEFNNRYKEKANSLRVELKDVSDRIRNLSEMMSADDSVLQDLSANRTENERLLAQEKQAILDESGCAEEAKNLFYRYNGLDSGIGMNIAPTSAKDLQIILDSLKNRIREMEKESENKSALLKGNRYDRSLAEAEASQLVRRKEDLKAKLTTIGDVREMLRQCLSTLNITRRAHPKDPLPPVREEEGIESILLICREEEAYWTEISMAYQTSKLWKDKLVKKSSKNVPKGYQTVCPCCERGMDVAQKEQFDVNVSKMFRDTKEEDIESAKREAEKSKSLLLRANELAAVFKQQDEYKTEIRTIDSRLSELTALVDQYRRTENDADKSLSTTSKDLLNLRTFHMELASLRGRWEDTTLRRQDCGDRKSRQSQSLAMADTGGRSFSDIEHEQRVRKEERDDLQKRKEQIQDETNRQLKLQIQLSEKLKDKRDALEEARKKEARQLELEARLVELDGLEKQCLDDRTAINKKMVAADRERQERSQAHDLAKAELRRAEDQASTQSLSQSNDAGGLRRLVDSLEQLETRFSSLDPKALETELENNTRNINEKQSNVREITPKIQSLNAKLSSQEHTKRIIADNLSLRDAVRERDGVQSQLLRLTEQFGVTAKQIQELEREVQRSEQELQKHINQRSILTGRIQELVDQAEELQATLNNSTFKGIDQRYRKKNIEYETTMMAVADLDSYYIALDRALLNFHTLKIKEVNKIVKELWQLIYRGQDIDMIEIVSGEEGEGAGAAATKRSYNYRVVMRKGDAPLDMRGRCSAGQCVLAGIVIRLALAETFCLSCGILALDEPTTNLDEPNKAGLAHALARIISSRSRQQNFQLLCITHDEDFVQIMRTELSSLSSFSLPEYYFRVSRQEEGNSGKFFSKIERIPWEDM